MAVQQKITLGKIASLIGATLEGESTVTISGIAILQHAKKGDISFLNNPLYRRYLPETQASAVILSKEDQHHCNVNRLICDNPYLAYATVATLFDDTPQRTAGIHPSVVLGENTHIHPSVYIGPFCVIGNHTQIHEGAVIESGCHIGDHCIIGKRTRLWSRVTFYHRVKVGDNVIIHSGAVLGSDGFGLAPDKGIWHKIPQIGGVTIGNNVEIGANTTIDRGAIEDTFIDDGVKLDNQIQIGHNVKIGAHTAIAGCVGIAGSTTIGKHCGIGGGAGILGHLTIGDQVMITAGTGVGKSLEGPGIYSSGIDAQPAQEWRKNMHRLHRLDSTVKHLKDIDKELAEMKSRVEGISNNTPNKKMNSDSAEEEKL